MKDKFTLGLILVLMVSMAANVVFLVQTMDAVQHSDSLEQWKREAVVKMDSLDNVVTDYIDTVNNDRTAAEQIIIPDKPILDETTVNRNLPADSVVSLLAKYYSH